MADTGRYHWPILPEARHYRIGANVGTSVWLLDAGEIHDG